MLTKQFFETTRGRIVALLRRGVLTVDDMASELRISANAVRVQITAMERDGFVQRVGLRPGATRPSHLFELTQDIEQKLSRAYFPLTTQLVRVLTTALPSARVESVMREAGRGLARELTGGRRLSGNLLARVKAASNLMNQELGAVTDVEKNGEYVIRGISCPLAALTGNHPAVCLAMESLLTETIGARTKECCDRTERPLCCFKVRRR